jgi:cell division protein FtsQ
VKVAVKSFWKYVFISIIFVFLLGIYAATQSELLDVDEIEVVITGGNEISSDEVVTLSGISLSQSMTSVDSEEAELEILKNSWVDEVEVRKDWPDNVLIWVSLRAAFAHVVTIEGNFATVDINGIVLKNSRMDSSSNLVTLLAEKLPAPGAKVEGVQMLLEAAKSITPDLQKWVKIISPTANGVRVELDDSVFVELGAHQDFTNSISDLKAVLGQVELTCIQSIDVSIQDNPVVKRDNSRC